MANVIKTFETTNFRCVKSINKLTDSELHNHGYYRGYQCPHGHEIRDLEFHWCYECVVKIKSNIFSTKKFSACFCDIIIIIITHCAISDAVIMTLDDIPQVELLP